MKGEEMDLILRFRCDSCHKEFMVADEQVDAEYLNCPTAQKKWRCRRMRKVMKRKNNTRPSGALWFAALRRYFQE